VDILAALLKEELKLSQKLESIRNAIDALGGKYRKTGKTTRRKMSAAGRRKIAAAQKARWAKARAAKKT
jgi:hypothetical protein